MDSGWVCWVSSRFTGTVGYLRMCMAGMHFGRVSGMVVDVSQGRWFHCQGKCGAKQD